MRLYTYFRSSSAYRVRIALELKGLAYDAVPVHLLRDGGEQFSPDFRARNPAAQVPVLEVDHDGASVCLAQSFAIVEYLEECFPEPALLPTDLVERARVRELAQLVNSGIQPFQNTGTLSYLKSAAPALAPAQWLGHFLGRGLTALEVRARETSRAYLVGDRTSLADLYLVPQLYAARRFHVDLEPFPTLLRVEARCNALPAFERAHPDRQPDAKT